MSKAKVIAFEAREQLLQNAQIYLESVELFLEERDKAVPHLEHENDDLRFDALVLLGLITDVRTYLKVYVRFLSDPSPRIRGLSLKDLAELGKDELSGLRSKIKEMLSNPEIDVKRAAMEILQKF